jgi:hypothetical protein
MKKKHDTKATYYSILCQKFAMYIASEDDNDDLFRWLYQDNNNWKILFQACARFRIFRLPNAPEGT